MRVSEIMTRNTVCCTPDLRLQEAAKLMWDHDIGELPVVDSQAKPLGVITDRDIVCRALAQGRNPLELTAGDCMTWSVVSVTPNTSLQECLRVLENRRIRRVVVVDAKGRCCGIVSLADIARKCGSGVKREGARGGRLPVST